MRVEPKALVSNDAVLVSVTIGPFVGDNGRNINGLTSQFNLVGRSVRKGDDARLPRLAVGQ